MTDQRLEALAESVHRLEEVEWPRPARAASIDSVLRLLIRSAGIDRAEALLSVERDALLLGGDREFVDTALDQAATLFAPPGAE